MVYQLHEPLPGGLPFSTKVHMTDVRGLARGRELFQQQKWAESYRLLERADRNGLLEPEDLERLATGCRTKNMDRIMTAGKDAGSTRERRVKKEESCM